MWNHNTHPNHHNNISSSHAYCYTFYYNLNINSSIYNKNNNSAFHQYYNSNLYSYTNLSRRINYPPTSGSEGGDNESIKNIIAAGYHICSAPEAVECRAGQYPGLQISQLGQDVTCNPSVGLICQNNKQGLQQKCFDYEIRVKCCQCGTTTHIPTTTTTTTIPPTTTPTPSTTILTSTAPSTTKTTTVPSTSTTTPTSTPTPTSAEESTTQCSGEESCVWSDWINLGQPTSGSEGGDNESIKNIIAAGYHICSAPEAVECRAGQYPGLQISQLGQDVTCNPSVGLICQNNKQGLQQKCFDYEIRVKCCQCGTTTHIPTTTTTTTTTIPPTTTPTPSTTILTSTAPSTTKTTTLPSTIPPTTTATPSTTILPSTAPSTTKTTTLPSTSTTTPTSTPTPTTAEESTTQCSGEESCVCSIYNKNNNSAFHQYYNSNLYSYTNLSRRINYPVQW
ncbi:mucin-2-like [Salvelinus alpinus]|uniref:mucin-2-like n=1 Tax=Salvelinus alpinus TaxID=8036 RepID=UPI0039FBC6A9